jgi:hypothetical protein
MSVSDRRIPKEVPVKLARPDASQLRETAITQNVSAREMRVATEHVWRLGDPVLLGSPESGVRTRARVVCCQRIEKQQVRRRFRTFGPALRRDQGTFPRRENRPRTLYMGETPEDPATPRFSRGHAEFPAMPSLSAPLHSCVSRRIVGISTGGNPFSPDRFQQDTWASHRGDIGLWEPCPAHSCFRFGSG